MKSPLAIFILILLSLSGCRPEIEVLAPEKELYVVWGVLNPREDVQYVKVSKVFQTTEDAYYYASSQDFSADQLQVSISGNDKLYEGVLEEINRDSNGLFSPAHQLYRFETPPGQRLTPGKRYELRITKPDVDVDSFLVTAYTDIPTTPIITAPSTPIYVPNSNLHFLTRVDLSKDYSVVFKRGTGLGCEVRIFLNYELDGVPQQVQYGPTNLFRESIRCQSNEKRGELCYMFPENSVGRTLSGHFSQLEGDIFLNDTISFSNDPARLSQAVSMEVTTVDTFLTTYMYVNNSFGFGLNLLMDKPEFTNISGENIGIFGSINTAQNYIVLDACTKYKAGIINNLPGNCF